MKIFFHVLSRILLLILIVSLLSKETGSNLKELAMVYISFLVIVISVKHKYTKKIMCQSFFVVILGVFTYIFRDAYRIIQLIVELLFLVFVTELFITTLNFKEVVRLGKGAFKDSLSDDSHLQNIYIKIKEKLIK
ncbi:MAG: hypothetical protein LBV03_01870 [Fusobacteriales bacterium]|jgi:hypothetical protein|nr:hypothetical protein [Fusobacteriales bacterium]